MGLRSRRADVLDNCEVVRDDWEGKAGQGEVRWGECSEARWSEFGEAMDPITEKYLEERCSYG